MKLINKKTGEVKFVECIEMRGVCPVNFGNYKFNSIAELNEEWEDYEPIEPIFDERIRRGIRAWWDMQDNPFKYAHVTLKSSDKDLDGFYHWIIFAYIRNGKERVSTDMEFRTKNLYDYNSSHDYTKEELCG